MPPAMLPPVIPLLAILLVATTSGCSTYRSITDRMSGRTPLSAARKMEDPDFPDERRQGINSLSSYAFGRQPPYVDRYMQIAKLDPDWLVRATAIRALNRSRWEPATPLFIQALNDEHALVRVEAAKALANIPDARAVPILVRLLGDNTEDQDVRIASADALRHYHSTEVGRTLASQLNDREFAVAWQSRRTLEHLTGRDLRYDEAAWLNYLSGTGKLPG